MEQSLKHQVTIASPISNREEYLPMYLNCILEQSYPQELTSIFFLLNNSQDNSKSILYNFQNEFKNLYKKITIKEYNNKNIPSSKYRQNRLIDNRLYCHLADLRNIICDEVNTSWLFSVDSDIMLTKNALTKLMEQDKKAISALVCNGHEFALHTPNTNPYKFCNIMFLNQYNKYIHVRRSQMKGLIEVDLTGAVMLTHKSLYKKARYMFDSQGEDIPFCRDIQRLGERIYADCDLKLPHCMTLELLEKYKKGEFKF